MLLVIIATGAAVLLPADVYAKVPAPPSEIHAYNRPWSDGTIINVDTKVSSDDTDGLMYILERSAEFGGHYVEAARKESNERDRRHGTVQLSAVKNVRGLKYWFRVRVQNSAGEKSTPIQTAEADAVVAKRAFFDGGRFWMIVITLFVCGAVVGFIIAARYGAPLKIRPIAGLEAIEEAVGRATEMGRSCLFVPGIQDMNDIQTISGLSILSRVAERAAEYDCDLETPTSKSLVMTAARETVEAAFLAAGRPDAYNQDMVYYVTDEQFAYVSFLTGKMVREEPAACFYLGAFFAESLILAETGNSIGAIQIAGTAQPAQLPFFVAACDYTLIGEEFFAASAYLSGDPDQLGSLKGQDVGKIIVGALIFIGIGLVSLNNMVPSPVIEDAAHYLTEVMLHAGG